MSILFIVSGFVAMSQADTTKREDRKEQIKAHKIAFISNELSLTPEEAEEFWPVYNQYTSTLEKIRTEKRSTIKQLRRINELSEEQSYELTQKVFELEKSESDTRLEYLDKFADVLDKRKAARVFVAEEKFKRELLKKIKHEGHKPHHDGPPRGPRK